MREIRRGVAKSDQLAAAKSYLFHACTRERNIEAHMMMFVLFLIYGIQKKERNARMMMITSSCSKTSNKEPHEYEEIC